MYRIRNMYSSIHSIFGFDSGRSIVEILPQELGAPRRRIVREGNTDVMVTHAVERCGGGWDESGPRVCSYKYYYYRYSTCTGTVQ